VSTRDSNEETVSLSPNTLSISGGVDVPEDVVEDVSIEDSVDVEAGEMALTDVMKEAPRRITKL
jgi:hypothetical protein